MVNISKKAPVRQPLINDLNKLIDISHLFVQQAAETKNADLIRLALRLNSLVIQERKRQLRMEVI